MTSTSVPTTCSGKFWRWIRLTWMGNGTRIVQRKICCEQRTRWTPKTVQLVRDSTNCHCFYCRIPFDSKGLSSRMHVDHYWPYSRGGSNLLENLVPACVRCNLAKSNRRPLQFILREYRTLYLKPFCRHKPTPDGKYCNEEPSRGRKFCDRHAWVQC